MDESVPRARALLLDYGGVLTTSVHGAFEGFCAREALDLQRFREVLGAALRDAASPAARVEIGALDPGAFDAEMAALLSAGLAVAIEPKGLVERMFRGVRTEQRMVEGIATIRAKGVPVVLVSNSWGGATYDPQVIESLFDQVIISGEVGFRKPDPEIFQLAAERAGVDPSGCVFVDDLPLNCEGARAVGMEAIHHTDPESTLAALHARF